MSRVPPNQSMTLRFKQNIHTILLEVDELQKLSEVRAELLRALIETSPGGKFNGQNIPKNADHIKLGSAIDRNDLSKGYASLTNELDEVSDSGKGKGKATASKAKTGLASIKDCPKGVGLRNGDIVAFKFVDSHDVPGDEDLDIVEEWDVKVKTIEELYKEEDEGNDMDEG